MGRGQWALGKNMYWKLTRIRYEKRSSSLYNLFGTTRKVLKAAGPGVGACRDSVL